MQSAFLMDYIFWVFISTLAVVQFAAARSGIWGMLYAREWPKATQCFALMITIVAFVWYFVTEDRNQPDTGLGLDANVQAFWFAASGAVAVSATLIITSVINHRWGGEGHGWDNLSGEAPPTGIAWLSQTTFFHAIRARIAYLLQAMPKQSSR